MAVTIKFLAKQIGVSPSVVSSVLNGKNYCRVSDQRRKEILALAKKLNCCPNSAAQALKSGRSRLIGILMPTPVISCYARMATYLQRKLQSRSRTALFSFWNSFEKGKISTAYENMLRHGVDGIITWNNPEIPELHAVPTVMYSPERSYSGDCVLIDEESLADQVASFMKKNGHANIGAVMAPRDDARISSFRKKCGLSDENMILVLGNDQQVGEKIFQRFIRLKDPPRLWFFCNQETLQAFTETASLRHYPLDRKISVICFEDTPCILSLPLNVTFFNSFREETVDELINVLLSRLEHPEMPVQKQMILPALPLKKQKEESPPPDRNEEVSFSRDIYCNPLPLPDYPEGMFSPSRYGKVDRESDFMGSPRDFRELADPDVIYMDGCWYLFPSCRQAYVSENLLDWRYEPVRFEDAGARVGYAPSIVRCGDRFLLTYSVLESGSAQMFSAPAPLGPYHRLGTMLASDGGPVVPGYLDPALFCDEDGRLYLYWGYGGAGNGVFGVELDAKNPVRAIGKPVKICDFDPENVFERYGEYNEHPDLSYIEGVSMLKHEGRYYLQYSFNGTHFRHYGLGMRTGDSPLGPFQVQREPMALSPYGMVCGSGHGAMAKGPDGIVREFYTTLIRGVHKYERRIAMDRVDFDRDGTVRMKVTSTPQYLGNGGTGLLPVSVNKPITGSSWDKSHYPSFANDDCTHTCWVPSPEDAAPYLEVDLRVEFELSAMRILWSEPDLDYKNGKIPEPVRFRVEFRDEQNCKLDFLLDFSKNATDRLIEFTTFSPVRARFVRLLIPGKLHRFRHGVSQWTLFGHRNLPSKEEGTALQ